MSPVLTCRWIPNTLDRVRISIQGMAGEATVGQVARVLGRDALEGLYLRGSFVLDADEDTLWGAAQQLLMLDVAVPSAAD